MELHAALCRWSSRCGCAKLWKLNYLASRNNQVTLLRYSLLFHALAGLFLKSKDEFCLSAGRLRQYFRRRRIYQFILGPTKYPIKIYKLRFKIKTTIPLNILVFLLRPRGSHTTPWLPQISGSRYLSQPPLHFASQYWCSHNLFPFLTSLYIPQRKVIRKEVPTQMPWLQRMSVRHPQCTTIIRSILPLNGSIGKILRCDTRNESIVSISEPGFYRESNDINEKGHRDSTHTIACRHIVLAEIAEYKYGKKYCVNYPHAKCKSQTTQHSSWAAIAIRLIFRVIVGLHDTWC